MAPEDVESGAPRAPASQARLRSERLVAEGNSAEDAGDLDAACDKYREAIASDPAYANGHLNLGIALAAAGDAEGAVAAYERALSIDPGHAPARYNLALAVLARGDTERGVELLQGAIATRPAFFEARVVLANALEALDRLDDAEECLRGALEIRPDHAGAQSNLGMLLLTQGRLDEAGACLERAVLLQPDYADAHCNAGSVAQARGNADEALICYAKALSLDPNLVAAHFQQGTVLQAKGDAPLAAASFRRALALNPDLPDAHFRLGNILQAQGDFDEAARCFRAVVALQPEHADAHNNLGTVLQAQGKTGEAFAWYRKATALRPAFAEAHCNLGCAFQEQGRMAEAIACFRTAIAVKPDFAEAQYNLASALHVDEALPHYERALALKPDYAMARWGIALAHQVPTGPAANDPALAAAAFSNALAELDRWFDETRIADGVKAVGCLPPFFLAYRETNNRDVLRQYGKLCVRLMKHWQDAQGLALRPTVPGAVLRIGIVSAHIHDHSVWNAIVKGWFRHLDRTSHSLLVFHTGREQDKETAFARSHAAHFVEGKRGLREWAQSILAERLDVLIYPEIGMDPVTIRLASMRLAPVQAATWGHPETTGLSTIDHFLSAEDLEPADAREKYTEQLVTLPNLGCCYEPLSVTPIPADLAALGVKGDRPILICAGTPYKYVTRHDWVFVAIARRTQRCQFVFSLYNQDAMAHALHARLDAAFAAAGMDFREFGVFLPWQSRPAYFGLLQRADAYLDTIGFSGFNTAMQAIECGLPIVTREGQFLRGRLASGILKRMGLADCVAATEEAYVELAVTLALDPAARARVRQRIETSRSILFGDVEPIRAFEKFLGEAVLGR